MGREGIFENRNRASILVLVPSISREFAPPVIEDIENQDLADFAVEILFLDKGQKYPPKNVLEKRSSSVIVIVDENIRLSGRDTLRKLLENLRKNEKTILSAGVPLIPPKAGPDRIEMCSAIPGYWETLSAHERKYAGEPASLVAVRTGTLKNFLANTQHLITPFDGEYAGLASLTDREASFACGAGYYRFPFNNFREIWTAGCNRGEVKVAVEDGWPSGSGRKSFLNILFFLIPLTAVKAGLKWFGSFFAPSIFSYSAGYEFGKLKKYISILFSRIEGFLDSLDSRFAPKARMSKPSVGEEEEKT